MGCADDQTTEKFRYTPLDLEGSRTFRLLRVLPDSDSKPVRIVLFPVSFDEECPAYNALSYTWKCQPPHLKQQIYCNNLSMTIGYNLWSFLHQVRKSDDTERWLWVDAVCINQQDVLERNYQVAQMRDIYAKAASVVVWLGTDDDTDDAADAFSLVNGFHKSFMLQDSHHDLRWHRSPKQWRALECLLNRSYWNRFWIIQEFILARKVYIRCGNHTSPLDDFELLCQWLENDKPSFRKRHTASAGIVTSKGYQLAKHRTEWRKTNGVSEMFSLRRLLEAHSSSESSELRDQIYALLGLVCKTYDQGIPIQVDYRKSPVEVFVDVVRNQCIWTTPDDRLSSQHFVLFLKRILAVRYGQVHEQVLLHARDLEPVLHLLTSCEIIDTEYRCIGTIIEIFHVSTSQGLVAKQSGNNWYQRHLAWNVKFEWKKPRHAAVPTLSSSVFNSERPIETWLLDDLDYCTRQNYGRSIYDVFLLTQSPPNIFIGTGGTGGYTRDRVQSGDLICVSRDGDSPQHAVIMRGIGSPGEGEPDRIVGRGTMFICDFERVARPERHGLRARPQAWTSNFPGHG